MDKWLQKLMFVGGVFSAMALLTACFGGGADDPQILGSEALFAEQSEATLACNAMCADRGQCGALDDGQQVVLMTSFGPEVRGHDLLVASGTPVTIASSQNRMVQKVSNNASQQGLNFYLVQAVDKPAAWVAGWCVQQPEG